MSQDIIENVKMLHFFCSEGVSRIHSSEDRHVVILNPLIKKKVKLPKSMGLYVIGAIDLKELNKINSIGVNILDPDGSYIVQVDVKQFLLDNISNKSDAKETTCEFHLGSKEPMVFETSGFYEVICVVNDYVIGTTGFYIDDLSGGDNE